MSSDLETPLLQGLPALVGPRTRLLVLGSFPGVASLQAQQYYAHPRNQFWRLLASLAQPDPQTDPKELLDLPYADRCAWLLKQGLGLWDVYARCRRSGSLDSAIRDSELNDLGALAQRCPELSAIAHNGGESWRHARITRTLGWPVYRLPSSSPANASWSFERKREAWGAVFAQVGLPLVGSTVWS